MANRRDDINTQDVIDYFKKVRKINRVSDHFDCSDTLVLHRFEKVGFDYEKYMDRKKRKSTYGISDDEEIENMKEFNGF